MIFYPNQKAVRKQVECPAPYGCECLIYLITSGLIMVSPEGPKIELKEI